MYGIHSDSQGRTTAFFSRLRRVGGKLILAGTACSLALSAGAQVALLTPAYQFAASANVGTAETATVTVPITAAGSLSAVKVTTQGVAGQDFTFASNGTCSVGLGYFTGQSCTVVVSFQPKFPGVRQGAVVLLSNSGTVLGSELVEATGVGATAVFFPGMISTVAGNGQWIYRGDGGLATQSPLFLPMGGSADSLGNLFLSDSNNHRIRRVDKVTGIITTVAGNGTAGFSGDGGPAASAMMDTPADVKLDGVGNLYIADSANHAIRMVSAATGNIYTIAGIGGKEGYSGDGGQATLAHLAYPSGVAFDGDHLLYISDTGNNAIRRVDLTTGIITTVAGTGTAGYAGDGGAATSALLNYPWGIALGGDGSLYIADLSNNCVRKLTTAGTISTVAGTGARGYGGDAGPATLATLNVPAGVVVDVAGNLYVADSGNHLVRKVSAATGIIQSIAGTSNATSGDGGPANGAQLDGPYALFLDGPGDLYIADMFHQIIRMVSSNTASLLYPVMRVGNTSPPQPESIEDDGNATLNFSAFNLVSYSALDASSTTCALVKPLSVNQSCVLGVEFAPTVIGMVVNGSATVVSNAADNPGTINLSGQVLLVQPTGITLTPSANPVAVGALVTFTAAVSNGTTPAPTGTVSFLDGTKSIGTGILNGTGVATLSIATLTAGQHPITAVYSGDVNNATATSAVVTENVEQPTTTALTSTPNPSVAGTAVAFTATVKGPAGITSVPTGTVTLTDSGVPIGTATLNASGVATLSVSKLGGGTHNITANYSGDSLDLSSQSVVLVQTVMQAATSTALTTSNASVYAGVSVTFSAVVSRTDGMIPTGAVTFLDGTTTLGSGTLDGTGKATFATSSLMAGSHSITAAYSGDTNNLISTSTAVVQTVLQIATSTTLATGTNPGVAGAPFILTATVVQSGTTGAGGPFSGAVTFLNGTATLGTATVSSAGIATLSVSTLTVGADSVTATYTGNTNYVGSKSSPLVETIVPATTTTVLVSSGTPSIAGSTITLTAVVAGNGGVPAGTVTFVDAAGGTLGTGTLNAKGVAVFITSTLAVGSHTLTAVYGGDPGDTASTSAPVTQVVQIATTSTALATSVNPSAFGASITFTASVTTNGGAPTGTVTFADGATVLGSASLSAGAAIFSTSSLALGSHSITAAYSGDANNSASVSPVLNQQVLQAGGITLATSANPAIAATNVIFTATIAAPQGAAVTGTVTFRDGATILDMGTVGAGGVATFGTAALAVGQHSITASYGGDANNQAATSSILVQTVQIAGTSVTLISSANPSVAGAPLTFTTTVVGKGGGVTGTVTFQDGTTTLGAATLNASGVATFALSSLSPGVHSVIAVYSGDANNSPSTSPTLVQTVVQATTVSVVSSENPSYALDSVTFTAKVSNGSSKPPTGTVVFSDGTTMLGSATLDATGSATFTPGTLTTGQHSLSVAYSGDSLNLAAVSAVLAQAVQLRPTTDTLTASSTSLTGGQQVTLISVVRYTGPVAPTGTVTFTSSGIVLGTVIVDKTGVATITVNLLTSSPTVIASYSGDSVYTSSVSSQTSIIVASPTQFTMQMNPSSVSVQSQQHSTVTLTMTSVNNFTDTLNLGCLGLPFAATCTFSKDSVVLGAGGTQVVNVVVDTGSPLTSGPQASLDRHGAAPTVALCLLPGGALLGLLFWSGPRRKRNSLAGLWMLLLLAGIATGLSGCAGLQVNGTPPGTYVFQMTATGLGTGTTQSVDITLTVTQ